jgi:hypothetical protein
MNKFLLKYTACECTLATQDILDKYAGKIPEDLFELWEQQGFGKYNDGLLELINPEDFNPTLWTWLGKEFDNYVPIAMSAYGDLFYYRKLTETDEDVCYLNVHYRKIETCFWSLDGFFNDYLIDPDIIDEILRRELFVKALKKYRKLDKGEIFYFSPALALGGSEDIKCIEKGNALVHLDLLFQLN